MKKIFVLIAGSLFVVLNAANIDWLVKVDKTSTVKDAQKASVDGIMPKDSKKVTTKGSENLQIHRMAGRLYFSGTEFRGIACAKLTFDNDCTQMIGFGANNFCTLFINGEQIATTEPGGNFYRPIHATNYVKNVKFKKGDNFVAMFLRPGAIGWGFAFDLIPDFSKLPATVRERDRLIEQLFPPEKAGLVAKECLYYTSTDKVCFNFETGLPTMAGIRYKKAGDKRGSIVWDSQDGVRRKASIHRVEIKGLKPATQYNYEVVELDPRTAKIKPLSKGSFTTFPEKSANTKFMIISDTQCDWIIRKTMVKKMLDIYGGRDMDFFLSLGDMSEGFADFRDEYFTNFYDEFPKNKYLKPVFFVRGNHEFRGQDGYKYSSYFGKSYYAFRHGDTFVIVLESGEDKRTFFTPGHYTLSTDTEYYFAEQREWLRNLIETPECKTAKHRIVLSHGTPFSSFNATFSKNIESMAGEFFYGKNPKCKIDLWLSAHTHAPYMYDPAAGKFFWMDNYLAYDRKSKANKAIPVERKKAFVFKEQDKKNFHFPIIVNDGPAGAGVHLSALLIETTPENIKVKMFPVSETASTYSDMKLKAPMLDVVLERGKPVRINSSKLVEVK